MFKKRCRICCAVTLLLFSACASSNSSKKSFESQTYTNAKYHFTLDYPKSWTAVDRQIREMNKFVVTVFKEKNTPETLPLGVHADKELSYVAVWPDGLGTELPKGQSISLKDTSLSLDLSFALNREESHLLLLNDGSPWAYFLRPKQPPQTWSNFGFIFAQIRTAQPRAICYDKAGRQLALENCSDYSENKKVIRTGNIDEERAREVAFILENFRFAEVKTNEASIDSSIRIEAPLPQTVVQSPLTVKGKAKGNWYFEGVFTVRMYSKNGQLLDTGIVRAQSNWMTEQWVPFEATLEFNTSNYEGGRLVFQNANPTGLAKYDKQYIIPVLFKPEE